MEFFVDFHENDEEHEHEERIVEVFTIDSENFYEKIDEIEIDGKTFWICQEVFLDEFKEKVIDRGGYVVFEFRDGYLSPANDEVSKEILKDLNNRRSP